jgi:hypothetical protein
VIAGDQTAEARTAEARTAKLAMGGARRGGGAARPARLARLAAA